MDCSLRLSTQVQQGNPQALLSCVFRQLRLSGISSWALNPGLPEKNASSPQFSADKGYEYTPPRVTNPACTTLSIKVAFVGPVSKVGGRSATRESEKLCYSTSDRSIYPFPCEAKAATAKS